MHPIRILGLAALACLGANLTFAADGNGKPGCCARHTAPAGPCRLLTCRLEVKTVKVSKSCFKTECENICIPAITFPWEPAGSWNLFKSPCDGGCTQTAGGPCDACRAAKCGRVKTVRVLKSESYEVEGCVCEWTIEEVVHPRCGKPACCSRQAPDCCKTAPGAYWSE